MGGYPWKLFIPHQALLGAFTSPTGECLCAHTFIVHVTCEALVAQRVALKLSRALCCFFKAGAVTGRGCTVFR